MNKENLNEECKRCGLLRSTCENYHANYCMNIEGQKHDFPKVVEINTIFVEKMCDCAEITCKEDCHQNHTHKTFWCDICSPEQPKEEKVSDCCGEPLAGWASSSACSKCEKLCKSTPTTSTEWEERFRENFNAVTFIPIHSKPAIKSFIKSEKEKSYQEGLHKGYAEEVVGCQEHCKKSYSEGYEEGKREERERIMKNLEDRKIDISQPQNAFNLIVNEGNDVEGQVYGYNKALADVLEFLTKANK